MDTPRDQTVNTKQKPEPSTRPRIFTSELLAVLAIANERITEIRNRSPQDAFGRYSYSESDRAEMAKLKAKKKEIEDRLLAIQI